jgi:hypothetical protein
MQLEAYQYRFQFAFRAVGPEQAGPADEIIFELTRLNMFLVLKHCWQVNNSSFRVFVKAAIVLKEMGIG